MNNEKIEIIVSEEEGTKVEITLPHYRKGECHAFKIFSKEKCILICHGLDSNLDIKICHSELAFRSEQDAECTKDEFDILYGEVALKLNELAK